MREGLCQVPAVFPVRRVSTRHLADALELPPGSLTTLFYSGLACLQHDKAPGSHWMEPTSFSSFQMEKELKESGGVSQSQAISVGVVWTQTHTGFHCTGQAGNAGPQLHSKLG